MRRFLSVFGFGKKRLFTDLQIDIYERSVALKAALDKAKAALGEKYKHHEKNTLRFVPRPYGAIECEWGPPPFTNPAERDGSSSWPEGRTDMPGGIGPRAEVARTPRRVAPPSDNVIYLIRPEPSLLPSELQKLLHSEMQKLKEQLETSIAETEKLKW
jgi:hypothetical protein